MNLSIPIQTTIVFFYLHASKFISSPLKGHHDYVSVWAVMNKAAMHVSLHLSMWAGKCLLHRVKNEAAGVWDRRMQFYQNKTKRKSPLNCLLQQRHHFALLPSANEQSCCSLSSLACTVIRVPIRSFSKACLWVLASVAVPLGTVVCTSFFWISWWSVHRSSPD